LEETPVQKKKNGIAGSVLKWIAVLSMFIDHTAAVLVEASWRAGLHAVSYNGYLVLRGIGRLAFPIYCFLLAEGMRHTRNVKRYLLRLGLFALISELPFDLAFRRTFFTLNYQNVFFTLFFGLLALSQWQWLTGRKGFHAAWQRQALGLLFIAALALAAEFCRTDYGWQGVAVIALMYLLREYPVPRDLGSLAVLYTSSTLELAAFPDVVLFRMYNGERGRQSKYFFYIFYPAHLLLLAGIRWYLWRI
jgi:hypothetical protein